MKRQFTFSTQLRILLFTAGLLIVIEVINALLGHRLNSFGILPRSLSHLPGILAAPLLHGSPAHLATNLIPLLLFIWLSMQWGVKVFLQATATIWLLSGLCVWIFAREAYHVGASGIVYGYFGFLVAAGFSARNFKLLAISIGVAFLYGGMLFGIFPQRAMVSFEYHLFGLIAGIIGARAWAK